MIVQPYFPEPVTVPGSVANEPYDVRLGFVRTTVAWHVATVAVVALIAAVRPMGLMLEGSLAIGLGSLLVLSVSRKLHDRTGVAHWDWWAVKLLGPLALIGLGEALGALSAMHYEVWTLGLAALATALYTLLCGRDLSFVGMFGLGSLFVIGGTFGLAKALGLHAGAVVWGCLWGVGSLFFLVYDLASLLQRRRLGEEVLAAADLYRDAFNFISYPFRVANHWRSFRI